MLWGGAERAGAPQEPGEPDLCWPLCFAAACLLCGHRPCRLEQALPTNSPAPPTGREPGTQPAPADAPRPRPRPPTPLPQTAELRAELDLRNKKAGKERADWEARMRDAFWCAGAAPPPPSPCPAGLRPAAWPRTSAPLCSRHCTRPLHTTAQVTPQTQPLPGRRHMEETVLLAERLQRERDELQGRLDAAEASRADLAARLDPETAQRRVSARCRKCHAPSWPPRRSPLSKTAAACVPAPPPASQRSGLSSEPRAADVASPTLLHQPASLAGCWRALLDPSSSSLSPHTGCPALRRPPTGRGGRNPRPRGGGGAGARRGGGP
jgi:hypothetical protein